MGSGADGNRSVTVVCDLDKVRQEALKTPIPKSSLDVAALKRQLRHCVFYRHVEASAGPEKTPGSGWGVPGRAKWMADKGLRDTRSVQAAHSEV
jgi:hypothetical protein